MAATAAAGRRRKYSELGSRQFYGRNPQTGGTIYLTIQSNGTVTVDTGCGVTYATINGENLTIDGIIRE